MSSFSICYAQPFAFNRPSFRFAKISYPRTRSLDCSKEALFDKESFNNLLPKN
jgi:hypothetical protein